MSFVWLKGLRLSILTTHSRQNIKRHKMASGIYEIFNTVNDKRYIGSSYDVAARLYEHRRLLRNFKHHSIALQRAWNKYGEGVFEFRLLEACNSSELITKEQEWMTKLGAHYNMCPIAGSRLGKKHTLETLRKLSETRKRNGLSEAQLAHLKRLHIMSIGQRRPLQWRLNIAKGLRGKKHPPERTALQIGNKRGAVLRSAETRRRISEAKKKWWSNRKQLVPPTLGAQ